MKFSDFSLNEKLLKNLSEAGLETPTSIQGQALPVFLEGHDLLGIAQTGTGKTAAFSLPLIQHVLNNHLKTGPSQPLALVLAPTRELASQIDASLKVYGKGLVRSTAIYGGVGQSAQDKALREGIDILVATPGRLLDFINQKIIRLNRIEVFVIDEADRMLDMGFIEDMQKIIDALPAEKQTALFSATMPVHVMGLAKSVLHKPKKVEVAPSGTSAENIDQKIIMCRKEDKFQLLRKILKEEKPELVIIFTKRKDSAEKVKEYLRFHRIPALVIHGDKDQSHRERSLQIFKTGGIKNLIATDVAARGIDVPDVTHVINFELPMEAESYVHRIGRTARAGKQGKAITFCDESEWPIVEKIKKLINKEVSVEAFKGTPEPAGVWSSDAPMPKRAKPPTPGKSQEKTAYLDHSKRQRVLKEGEAKPRYHPGFKKKKRK